MESADQIKEEQLLYARWLDAGTRVGLLLLIGMFLVYVFSLLPTHVPHDRLSELWGLPVDVYLDRIGVRGGWSWVEHVHKGDFLNFVPVVFLALVTVICYLRMLPLFIRRGEKVFAAIAAAEIFVLVLAASGLVSGGH